MRLSPSIEIDVDPDAWREEFGVSGTDSEIGAAIEIHVRDLVVWNLAGLGVLPVHDSYEATKLSAYDANDTNRRD